MEVFPQFSSLIWFWQKYLINEKFIKNFIGNQLEKKVQFFIYKYLKSS